MWGWTRFPQKLTMFGGSPRRLAQRRLAQRFSINSDLVPKPVDHRWLQV